MHLFLNKHLHLKTVLKDLSGRKNNEEEIDEQFIDSVVSLDKKYTNLPQKNLKNIFFNYRTTFMVNI